jgi:hypothetical protein
VWAANNKPGRLLHRIWFFLRINWDIIQIDRGLRFDQTTKGIAARHMSLHAAAVLAFGIALRRRQGTEPIVAITTRNS